MNQKQLDVSALYRALDVERRARKLSWRQLASEAKIGPSTLTRLGQGKRPDVDSFAALVQWLGVPPESFLRGKVSDEAEPDLVTVVSTLLRARKDLKPATAKALEDILAAAYEHLKKDDEEAS